MGILWSKKVRSDDGPVTLGRKLSSVFVPVVGRDEPNHAVRNAGDRRLPAPPPEPPAALGGGPPHKTPRPHFHDA